MNIVISVNNNEEIIVIPVVPPDIEFDEPWNNEERDSVKYGKFTLIGLPGARSFTLESFFPVNKKYSFVKSGSFEDGNRYIEFFRKWRKDRVPFRVVITSESGNEILNLPMSIEGMKHKYDKAGDIIYSLEFKEFKFII